MGSVRVMGTEILWTTVEIIHDSRCILDYLAADIFFVHSYCDMYHEHYILLCITYMPLYTDVLYIFKIPVFMTRIHEKLICAFKSLSAFFMFLAFL